MRQFWNELNGLAPKCNFWGITERLVKDVFSVNMANKDVQQKLCTESKTTVQETIQFAISYEEGAIKQQSFEKLDKPVEIKWSFGKICKTTHHRSWYSSPIFVGGKYQVPVKVLTTRLNVTTVCHIVFIPYGIVSSRFTPSNHQFFK